MWWVLGHQKGEKKEDKEVDRKETLLSIMHKLEESEFTGNRRLEREGCKLLGKKRSIPVAGRKIVNPQTKLTVRMWPHSKDPAGCCMA